MNRKDLLNRGFKRGDRLVLSNPTYLKWVKRFTEDILEQDLGEMGDITTTSIFGDKTDPARAVVRAKEDGVMAGIAEVTWFYEQHGIAVTSHKRDGDPVHAGDLVLELRASEKRLLETERTGLKVLQRMSGIATMTRRLLDQVKAAGADAMIVATRKTHWPLLDKKAVWVGGGGTHRLGLWEAILIKDNHLEGLKREGYQEDYIEEALTRAWQHRDRAVFIEVEVEDEVDALTAAKTFNDLQGHGEVRPCVIMLDNMPPPQIRGVITVLKERGLYDSVLLEASGGIAPDNLIEYAQTGVDILSLGSLTHSPKALDLNQTLIR
jgi:nicotinate-nucleotide pyrophosphorylase (carboxylating)